MPALPCPVDNQQVEYLYGRLLNAEPQVASSETPRTVQINWLKTWVVMESQKKPGITTVASGGGTGEVRPDNERWTKGGPGSMICR